MKSKAYYGYLAVIALLCCLLITELWLFKQQYAKWADRQKTENYYALISLEKGKVIDPPPPPEATNSTAPAPAASSHDSAVAEAQKPSSSEEHATAVPEAKAPETHASAAKTPEPSKTEPPAATEKPVSRGNIAILIRDLGLSASSTERALQLPAKIALGFSPYSYKIRDWAMQAKSSGHEILLNLPMEPVNYPMDDPGPYALLTTLPDSENNTRLGWVVKRVTGLEGVYTPSMEKFTLSPKTIRPILDSVKARNLLFIYGGSYDNITLQQTAVASGVAFIGNDVIIDAEITDSAIAEKLAALEKKALSSGQALGIGSPYPITLKMLADWLPTLEKKGITLVTIRTLAKGKTFKP